MQKYMGAIISVVVFVVIIAVVVADELEWSWKPFDYARITELDYTAVVVDEPDGDGKVVVTERLTFEIHAASRYELFWELWRDLPEKYVDGVMVKYKVNSVKQILDGQSEKIEYQPSRKLYWYDSEFTDTANGLGPGKWYHSEGPYSEAMQRYECVLIYVDGLYRETVVFEIEYELYNASLRYNDCSQLYLTLFSEDAVKHLKSLKGQILVPSDIMPRPGNYEAFTYGTNAHAFPFAESDTANPGYHTFSFELDRQQLKFRPYNQYIEFILNSYGEDRHIFTRHASGNYYYYDDVLHEFRQEQAEYEALPTNFLVAKLVLLLLSLALAFLAAKIALGVDKMMKKKYAFYESAEKFEQYKEIPGELDPGFAAALVSCKHKSPKDNKDVYAALMLSLIRKNYIKLEKITEEQDWNPRNTKVVVAYNPAQTYPEGQEAPIMKPLTPTEGLYFNLILRHTTGEMAMTAFQDGVLMDCENTDYFVKNTQNAIIDVGMSEGYFQKPEYTEPKKRLKVWAWVLGIVGVLFMAAVNPIAYQTRLDLAFGAFFVLGAALVGAAVYLGLVSKKYVLLTQFGEDEYAKWRGLYNFLKAETLAKSLVADDPDTLELYLVYAAAFGISSKIDSIEIKCKNSENAHMRPMYRNPYFRSRGFYRSGRSFGAATRSASSTARSGGGGGYGGGRGGGGGGGGH